MSTLFVLPQRVARPPYRHPLSNIALLWNPAPLHTGAKEVAMEERVRIQEEFERGVTKVLICTDLMTRGIDVPGESRASLIRVFRARMD